MLKLLILISDNFVPLFLLFVGCLSFIDTTRVRGH